MTGQPLVSRIFEKKEYEIYFRSKKNGQYLSLCQEAVYELLYTKMLYNSIIFYENLDTKTKDQLPLKIKIELFENEQSDTVCLMLNRHRNNGWWVNNQEPLLCGCCYLLDEIFGAKNISMSHKIYVKITEVK